MGKAISMWDADGGEAARCYADLPFGHYKEEIYPLYGEILDVLGDAIRVLDVGPGPGHFAYEFYKRRPGSRTRFALLETGQAMLDIARQRIESLGFVAEYFQRDFNKPGWDEGLGKYDAVVSNNAIFNAQPELLGDLYGRLFGLLNPNGLLLNQQSCAHEHPDFAKALKGFPPALSPLRLMAPQDAEKAARLRGEHIRLNDLAVSKARDGAAALRAKGEQASVSGEVGYASLHLPASAHERLLAEAGFASGCIWRKMEFVVLVGIKGHPWSGQS